MTPLGDLAVPPEVAAIVQACRRRIRAENEVRDAILAACKAKVSRQAIADAAGVTRQRVWQIERGK